MSFARFRTPNISKPSYDQRGDISFPARALYKPSRVTPTLEDNDLIPLTDSRSKSTPVSRNNSFTMKTLNPRRLSIRLKSRPSKSQSTSPSPCEQSHNSTVYRSHTDPLPASVSAAAVGGGGARAEFVYKPIRRTDYTTVVSETATAQTRPSRNQYNYIPAGRGLPVSPKPRSRAHAHYALHNDEGRRSHDLYNDLDEGHHHVTVTQPRGEYADIYTSAEEKKRRAARRLTTVMVPNDEDIYG